MSEATEISVSDFLKCDIRVGTIKHAALNEGAHKPAYVLTIDFGTELGVRRSSAQIAEAHDLSSLNGMQVLAVTNFPPKRIAGVRSEVLVLAAVEASGRTVLVSPAMPVEVGSRIL